MRQSGFSGEWACDSTSNACWKLPLSASAIGFRRALRIGIGRGVRLAGDRARDVGYGLAAAEARGDHCRHGRGHKKPRNTARRTHGQIDTRAKGIRAERASNKLLTLTSG